MLPLQIVGMNLSLCTQIPSGTALRHRKEMRINMVQDGHVLRYCDNRVSQMLWRNKYRDKNHDKFMVNVAKTFPSQNILFT